MILGPHTITVLRPAMVAGDYGSGTKADWANATSTTVPGCSVQPAVAPDYTVDRDSWTSRWQVWTPPEADVRATDRVQWNGDTYDVEGEPLRWDYPPLSHLVIALVRSEEAA